MLLVDTGWFHAYEDNRSEMIYYGILEDIDDNAQFTPPVGETRSFVRKNFSGTMWARQRGRWDHYVVIQTLHGYGRLIWKYQLRDDQNLARIRVYGADPEILVMLLLER